MTVAVTQASASPYPLHAAAAEGNIDVFNTVVKEVDDLNVLNDEGQTPLHVAAIHGETTVGAYITECGGDVSIKDRDGNTALHLAAIHNKRLFASMLLWGEADPQTVNNKGNTSLHEAAIRGNVQVIFIIINNGGESSKDIKNADGKTPLDLARESGDAQSIRFIETGDDL
jgi:ankyrin repeat protein